jgi:hypothetical protein
MENNLERFFSPTVFDMALPFVAFFLVVLLPSAFALWVIYQVLSGRYSGQDRHSL